MASSSSSSTPTTTSATNSSSTKDDDVAFWLHNKLGSHGDLWSSFSISSTLTEEHLQSIKSMLKSLDTLVKIKLLLSLIHIPKRNIAEWEGLLNEIIESCHEDEENDLWIKVISEIIKTFPSKSCFNFDLTNAECEGFTDGMQELRKIVKKNNDTSHLPLESCYLGRSALKVLTGDIPNPPKCFSLIRKAKSARVRQDLLEKSAQTSKAKKTTDYAGMSTSRRLNDEPPSYYSSSSSTTKQTNHGFLKPNTISSSPGIIGTPRTPYRREGHVKILSLEEEQALSDKKRKKPTEEEDNVNGKKNNRSKKGLSQQQSVERRDSTADESSSTPTTPTIPTGEFHTSSRSDPFGARPSPPDSAPLSHNDMPPIPNPVMHDPGNDYFYGLPPPPSYNHPMNKISESSHSTSLNDLKLTDEQKNFARELFATSPCLTPPDKSRILNFIAGVRDHGLSTTTTPLVTIKLNEQDELISDANTGQPQKYFAETFFQMNTLTGEWKRIKKLRPINSMH